MAAGGADRRAERVVADEGCRSLFEIGPVATALISWKEGRYERVNDAFCRLVGRTSEEVLGQRDLTLGFWSEPGTRGDFIRRYRRDRIVENLETRFVRADGEDRYVLLSGKAATLEEREFVLCTATDITGYKRAALEREQVEARLRQAQRMEAIGTLAGGIAHDFNNVLAAILGYAELALDDVAEGTQLREDLEEVVRGAQRAHELVKQILTFSQRTETAYNAFGIQAVTREALKLLRTTLPAGIDIRSDLAADPWVMGNASQILQVLMNLCTNASDAMSDGGGVLKVSLAEWKLGEDEEDRAGLEPGRYAVLSVSDTGCGVPQHLHERIFEPFFTTKDKASGSGMGLSVAHGIVTRLGGRIRVRSEEGVGTTFDVFLPVHLGEPGLDPTEAPMGNGELLLVVDDEVAITRLAKKMLRGLGYEVETTNKPEEALERCRSGRKVDLVITDMSMPGMTGTELARALRREDPDLPVVLCTGHVEPEAREKNLDVGIAGYVFKPFARTDLAQVVRRTLDETIVV